MGIETIATHDPELPEEGIELDFGSRDRKSVLNSQGERVEASIDRVTYLIPDGTDFGTHETYEREVLDPLQLLSQREEIIIRPEGQSSADTLTMTTAKKNSPSGSIHIAQDGQVDRISLSNGNFIISYHREDDETFSYGVKDVRTTKPIGEPQTIHINDMQFLDIPGVSEALQHQLLRGRVDIEATKDALHNNYRVSVPKPLTESLVFI